MKTTNNYYDIIIIGGGPAGLTAGIYASRSQMNTVLLEKSFAGGQIASTSNIENYPGVKNISGIELAQNMEEQAKGFGLKIEICEVRNIEKIDDKFFCVKACEEKYYAPVIILTTGVRPKKLQVPGEKEFLGKGISFCAVCDGFFYRGKHVAVIGGGNSAVEEAIYLTKFAKKVSVIHRRDQLRAQRVIQERAFSNPKIDFIWDTIVEEFKGNKDNIISSIKLYNKKIKKTIEMSIDGVFIYIGTIPNLFMKDLELKLDDMGFVSTDTLMRTSIMGIFAAGDVRSKTLRQVVTAVGDGAIAAVSAENYLDSLKYKKDEFINM